jgi:hypothetical protein
VNTPRGRTKEKNKVRIISDIKLSAGKILPFLNKGLKEDEDPFIPKRSLARSPTDTNRKGITSEVEGDTPGDYSDCSNYSTPTEAKDKKDKTDLNKSVTKRNINKRRVKLAETGREAVESERETKDILDESEDTISIKMGI